MKIAACQTRVVFRDMEANLKTTVEALEKAEAEGVQILCMPETFLHGYFPDEGEARKNAVDLEGREFQEVLDRVKGFSPMLLIGLNERREGDLYNTVVVIDRGKLIGLYSKNYLVYPYFRRGHEFPVFEKDGVKFGIIICADSSYMEAARIEAMRGAQIIFSPHFNYITYDHLDHHTRRVRSHHIARAAENDCYVVKANVVVPQSVGEPVMGRAGVGVGDSFILDRIGRFVGEAGLMTETLLVHDIPEDDLAKPRRPFHRTTPEIARQLHAEYEKAELDRE
ncbi:MAG: carbon-nitrogen hydrolase family protein [Planctomycetes bacterium]|nr:carbon-nitrogen hydrolase family protein [Planctomycetota bacterium]